MIPMNKVEQLYPFRIYGPGIYSICQPRYATAQEAYDDLKRYARDEGQSPLMFTVYEDLSDGTFRLA